MSENNHEQNRDELLNILTSILNSASSVRVKNDEELLRATDRKSLKNHSDSYDNILDSYTDHVSKTLETKRKMKNIFFTLSTVIMSFSAIAVIACPIILQIIKIHTEDFNIIDYIVPVATALSSFLTVFIVIPKIIAEYLFNSNEDTVMKEIVSSIQEYDKYIRNKLQDKSDDSSQ